MSSLAWQKALRVMGLKDYARAQTDWPDALTPGELVALQYPREGTDPEKRKARQNQCAMVASIKTDVMAGNLATATRAVQEPIWENRADYWTMHRRNVRAQEFASSEWLYGASPGLSRGVISKKVKTGERTVDVQVITCRDFAKWFADQLEQPSEHINAWFVANGVAVSQGGADQTKTVAVAETAKERKNRITVYVDDAYARGITKKDSFKALSESEGCGVENIKRIYRGKDAKR